MSGHFRTKHPLKMRSDSPHRGSSTTTTLIAVLLILASGCGQEKKLVTEYGKVSGSLGSTSVNGTGILAGMFQDRGFRVKRSNRISPRLEKYETIVWFPNSPEYPSAEAVDALEKWLLNGYSRTLIYVGRDFDAELDYLQWLATATTLQSSREISVDAEKQKHNREEANRQLAEVKLKQDQRRFNHLKKDNPQECPWFSYQILPRHKAVKLSGSMAQDVDAKAANVELSTLLVPTQELLNGESSEIEQLLIADDLPLVFSIRESESMADQDFRFTYGTMDVGDNQIIIVSNGSFLLNYGLVNYENRKLAGALIDRCGDDDGVVFLESGPSGIVVTDRDDTQRNAWAWISEPPLRYIVPHFLLWGLLFCFVYFPIFGRPKRLKPRLRAPLDSELGLMGNQYSESESTSSFRSHIAAMGKLLRRTNQPEQAISKIQRYQENLGNDLTRKQDRL